MVRLKTNIVLVTSAFLVSVIIHSNYVSASDSKSLTDLETPEEPLVNLDDIGEDELKARNKRLVPTLGYSPRTLRRLQRSPLEEGEDIAKGTVVEEEGAEESSSKKRKGKKKKKKKKRRKDKTKTSSVEELTDATSGESDLIKGKSDSKVEPLQSSPTDLTPTDPPPSFATNDGSNTGSSSDDQNNSKTSNSGDSGSGSGGGKSQGDDDGGSEQRQSKSYKMGLVKIRQDSGQKSKQETINTDTKEIIPLHKDLPPMQRQQQKQVHRQETTQYNRQDTSLPADSVNFDRTSFKMPQMTQMAPMPGMAPMPQLSSFYSPMGGSKSSFTFPNFPTGQQPVHTNENPAYTANLGYNPYTSGSGNPVNSNPLLNPGTNPIHQMNTGNFGNNGNMPGGSGFLYAVSSRAFGNPDGQMQYGGSPGANFFSMNGGFANQAQSSFNSQSNSAQFHDQSFAST